jgi:hypothetical protein
MMSLNNNENKGEDEECEYLQYMGDNLQLYHNNESVPTP